MTRDLPTIRGPITVGYDCRPGDVINIMGRNARVVHTSPSAVNVEFNNGDTAQYTYQALSDLRVQYVAVLIPILPG